MSNSLWPHEPQHASPPCPSPTPRVYSDRKRHTSETPVLWPPHAKSWLIGKDWCWEGLEAGGEGDDRGWNGWMASLTWWTWVWVNSGSWWWTGRPGVLWFMGSQRVGHNWMIELNCMDKEKFNVGQLRKQEMLYILKKVNRSWWSHCDKWFFTS